MCQRTRKSVANHGASKLGDNHVDTVTAARELVRQNLSTEDSSLAINETGLCPGTTCGHTSRDVVGAASDRILDTPCDLDRWRWRWAANRRRTANRGRSTARGSVAKESRIGGRGQQQKQGDSRKSGDQTRGTVHGCFSRRGGSEGRRTLYPASDGQKLQKKTPHSS